MKKFIIVLMAVAFIAVAVYAADKTAPVTAKATTETVAPAGTSGTALPVVVPVKSKKTRKALEKARKDAKTAAAVSGTAKDVTTTAKDVTTTAVAEETKEAKMDKKEVTEKKEGKEDKEAKEEKEVK